MLRKVALVALSALLGACQVVPESTQAELPPSDPAPLLGTWQLQLGEEWPLKQLPELQFDAQNRVSGFAGCNRFMGQYRYSGQQLQLSGLATTRKLCAPVIMNQERILLSQLQQPLTAQRTAKALTLRGDEGTFLRFSLQ